MSPRQPTFQAELVRYGFRPINTSVKIESVTGSPWQQKIPGAQIDTTNPSVESPPLQTLQDISRLWERAQ